MSNTISVQNEIVADQVIEKFGAYLAPVSALSTDFSPKPGEAGLTINVGLIDCPVSGNLFAGDYTTNSDSSIAKVSVTLQHFYKSFKITDDELAASNVAKLENLIGVNAKALAKTIFSNVTAQFITGSAGFGPASVQFAATGFNLDRVKTMRAACDAAGMDLDGRALVLDSAAYTAALPVSATTINTETVTEGALPRAMGFDLYSVNWPTTSAQPVIGAALHPSAIACASRLPECQGKDRLEEYKVIEVPGVGIPVAYRRWYDANAGTQYGTLETLFGAKIGNTGAARIITSS